MLPKTSIAYKWTSQDKVASDQVAVQQVATGEQMGSEVGASAATAATKRELREVSNKLALRSFAFKQVVNGLEHQQKALEAASNASAKHLARVQQAAAAAIRRAQHAF